MSEQAGHFVWCEWMGADPARAAAFYGDVVGGKVAETAMAGFDYRIASAGDYGVAGLFAKPKEAQGAPSCGSGYVAVDDVDRAALVADPQGAPFSLLLA